MNTDQNFLDLVVSLEVLNDNQLLAGLAVLSKDLDLYLSQHPRKDAETFLRCYEEALKEDRKGWVGSPFFEPPEKCRLPTDIATNAAQGKFDLKPLIDIAIVHEWTVMPGRKILECYQKELKDSICGATGPYEQFRSGLIGQAQLPAAIATTVLTAGVSVATLWYPLAVYLALLFIRAGLGTYCNWETK
jgi:hypothetical protein